MKKIIIYILTLVLICILIPVIFTNKFETKEVTSENIENIEAIENLSDYDYKQYNKIKLLHTKTNEVEEVNLDEYLCNVVSAEMPANYEIESLKAQAIVARTYTIYQIKNNPGKHGYLKKIDLINGMIMWKMIIGIKYKQLLMKQKVK